MGRPWCTVCMYDILISDSIQVTIGVFGYPEHVISEPMTPKDLVKIIYDKCMPFDPTEAVLQQEVSAEVMLPLEICSLLIHLVLISDHDMPGELRIQYVHIPQLFV